MRKLVIILCAALLSYNYTSAQTVGYKEQLRGVWQLVEVNQIGKESRRSIQGSSAIRLQLKSRGRLDGTIDSPELTGWYWGKYKFRKDGTVKGVKAVSDYPYHIKDIQKKWDVDLYLVRLSSAKNYVLTDEGLLILDFEDGKFSEFRVGKGRLIYRKVE